MIILICIITLILSNYMFTTIVQLAIQCIRILVQYLNMCYKYNVWLSFETESPCGIYKQFYIFTYMHHLIW